MNNGNDIANSYVERIVIITEPCTPDNIPRVMTRIVNTIKVRGEIKIEFDMFLEIDEITKWVFAFDEQITINDIQYKIERVNERELLVVKFKVQEMLIHRLEEVEALLVNSDTVKAYIKLHAIIANLNVDKANNYDH